MSEASERTFSLKQVILVALPALVLLLALTGIYWWQQIHSNQELRRATLDHAELRGHQVNDALSEAVSMLFFQADDALQNLVTVYQPGKLKAFGELSKVLTHRLPEGSMLQIAVIGADGYMQYSNLGTQEKVYLGEREHFTVHRDQPQTGLFISKPLMGKVSKQWTIQFSRRIERQGRFAGVMVLSLSPNYLYRTLARLAQADKDVLLIVRDSGEIMARNRDMDKAVGVKSSQKRPYEQSGPGQSGSFTASGTIDGIERLYQWQHLNDYPVVVALGQSMAGLMAPAEKAIAQGMLKSAVSTLALWFSAVLAVILTLRMQAHIRRRVEFEHAALHDTLTGLKNRKALHMHLQALVAQAQTDSPSFGLLFIDLDGFKQINDQHGHTAGDTVLQTVGSRLRHCARNSDLVARMGGDEFVIVCHDVRQPQDIQKLVERIHAAMQVPMGIGRAVIHIGVSIGVALYPDQGRTADALLDASDRAMYRQKSERKQQPETTPA